MWFTRVSIGNPVFADDVMLAFVVLGLFSYQRLAVDQFPDVDFPGRGRAHGLSGRIAGDRRDREVTQQDRGGGQYRRRHQQPYSRSTKALGRHRRVRSRRSTAARPRGRAREGGADPADLPRRGQGAAHLRFDPADVPIFNVAVLPTAHGPARARGSSPPGPTRCCRSGWRTCAASAR